ncbi:hypothetical protein MCOR27_007106 [Pyricularia oryzae]|nr:hypothetical protein MCOR01_002725 [Pyricularia oryzae]KAI6275152.1 hypothetical protein MCOR27_007106 [Pyricularia oryzae]KAI6353860.1 hypothetical protein MCOR31_011625 [Pyricularia oryzae]KAI6406808.1 hypothetical protein MCOR24_007620 [Pyricularia oryzae]KAI6447980.1 hypothetical protein MCOR22_003128 [Pyricularia oryzae]
MADDPNLERYLAMLKEQKVKLVEALAHKGKKPPDSLRRSRKTLKQEFTMAALSKSMRNFMGQRDHIRACFIGAAYPPCTLPLSTLVPIMIRDLRLETQHRGRVLIVRAFCHPTKLTSIQNAIEDELGDVDRLAIYNLPQTVEPDAVLPQGAVVAIKEPYYKRTADGGLFVRVDHPSDFVRLRPGSSIIPDSLATHKTKADPSVLELKEDGNTAFKNGKFEAAIDLYSHALEIASDGDEDVKRDLWRNRSAAYLRLGRWELAISDALASMVQVSDADEEAKDLNIKALFRAGRAAYDMRDFEQAKRHFEAALALDKNHEETKLELSRTNKRLLEQESGLYDFSRMLRSVTLEHGLLDHASFLNRTKIAKTDNRGRGLFATVPLCEGDVIFVEKAFFTVHRDAGDLAVLININTEVVSVGTHNLRLFGMIDKMTWNPSLAKRYYDLFDGGKFGDDKQPKVVDGKVAVDTFRVQSIAELNGFGCPRLRSRDKERMNVQEGGPESSTGMWLHAAYANHTCIPNATRAFIGDMMIVRAARDIPAGAEIFMGYASLAEPFESRRSKFKTSYGFECDCEMCRAEAAVPPAAAEKRVRLREEIHAFLTANPLRADMVDVLPPSQKAKVKRLLKEIQQTYTAPYFDRLPRPFCHDIGLCAAMCISSQPRNALRAFLNVLRDSGYFVTMHGNRVTIDRRVAIQAEGAILAAMYASQCLMEIGYEAAACELEDLGREVFTSVSGVEDGFMEEFGWVN